MLRARFGTAAVAALAALLLVATPATAASPANDNFADAIVISGSSGSVTGTTASATNEAAEPVPAHSVGVWYVWTAPTSGTVSFETCAGASYDTWLDVYTGSALGALTLMTSNDDSCGLRSRVSFPSAGTTYYIRVGGFADSTGTFTLTWSIAPAPANDHFADAIVLSGASGSVTGTTVAASNEAGEPEPAHSVGVWYAWTPPAPGTVTFDTCSGTSYSAWLDVYVGSSLTSLALLDSGRPCSSQSRVTFAATDETYFIRVGALGPVTGTFTLRWSPPPANDDFANSIALSGASGSVTGTTVGATNQVGEPHAASASVWYSWTPPGTGAVTFDTCAGTSYASHIDVYTGSNVGALNAVPVQVGSCATARTFAAEAEAYRIRVGGFGGQIGEFTLSWSFTPSPANDDLTNATAITGTFATTSGTTFGATFEPGEPLTEPGDGSVWYAWTAPSAGAVVFSTAVPGECFARIDAFTGATVGTLTRVPPADTFCGSGFYRLTVPVRSELYFIRVRASSDIDRTFNLTWRFTPAPPNDEFAAAIAISGETGSVSGTTFGATNEPGEASTASVGAWYAWTAPSTGTARFETCASGYFSWIESYTGSTVATLVPLPGVIGSCGARGREFLFEASAGTTYYIRVGGQSFFGIEMGGYTLGWSMTTALPPPNDDFEDTVVLAGPTGTITGTTVGSWFEPGEPPARGVWYTWTATERGVATFGTCGAANYSSDVDAFTGSAVGSLTFIPAGGQHCFGGGKDISFEVAPGVTYHIRVASEGTATGNFTLTWLFATWPDNDDFANAAVIDGAAGSVAGTTRLTTNEADEPFPTHSFGVWYAWTAPREGTAAFDTCSGTNYDTWLDVYTGPSLDSLTLVASDDQACPNQSRVEFATENVTYYIRVGGYQSSIGDFTLRWSFTPAGDTTPPALDLPDDLTAEATTATGSVVEYTATATDDVDGELAAACSPASGSAFGLGTTTVVCTATDAAGNVDEGTFTVTVVDTTAPVLTLPGDLTVDATSPAGAVVTFEVSATDAVSGSPVVDCSPPAAGTFPIGTTTVTCSSADGAGNDTEASFSVLVRGAHAQILALIDKTLAYLDLPSLEASLRSRLDAAVSALLAENPAGACRTMTLYIQAVRAVRTPSLSDVERADLLRDAQRIRAVIGC